VILGLLCRRPALDRLVKNAKRRLVAWRWEVTGGVLLLIVGLTVGIAYAVSPPPQLPLVAVLITTVVFSAPPLLAGILFLLHQRSL
jgi:hypothetical protein